GVQRQAGGARRGRYLGERPLPGRDLVPARHLQRRRRRRRLTRRAWPVVPGRRRPHVQNRAPRRDAGPGPVRPGYSVRLTAGSRSAASPAATASVTSGAAAAPSTAGETAPVTSVPAGVTSPMPCERRLEITI